MEISNYTQLPIEEKLKRILLCQAALDIIMIDEEDSWLRLTSFYKNFNDWEWDPCLSGMCDQCTKIPDQTRGLAQLINNDKLITLCNKCAEDLGVKTI